MPARLEEQEGSELEEESSSENLEKRRQSAKTKLNILSQNVQMSQFSTDSHHYDDYYSDEEDDYYSGEEYSDEYYSEEERGEQVGTDSGAETDAGGEQSGRFMLQKVAGWGGNPYATYYTGQNGGMYQGMGGWWG